MGTESQEVAFFTNPQGVYNKYTGTWDVPDYWQTTKKHQQSKMRQEGRASGKRGVASGDMAKVRMVQAKDDESSEDSEEEPAVPLPQRKK